MKVAFKRNNPSHWANLVPKFKEVEEETRRPAEGWNAEVSAKERSSSHRSLGTLKSGRGSGGSAATKQHQLSCQQTALFRVAPFFPKPKDKVVFVCMFDCMNLTEMLSAHFLVAKPTVLMHALCN